MSLRSSTHSPPSWRPSSSPPAPSPPAPPPRRPRAHGGRAAPKSLFVITDQEGYGTGECLERQGGCGKVIADSFCESKGFRSAEFYRKAGIDDITGSLGSGRAAAPSSREPHAFVIGCR